MEDTRHSASVMPETFNAEARKLEERIAENVVKLLEGEDISRQDAKRDIMTGFLGALAPLREIKTESRELEERIAENVLKLLEEV